VLCCVCCVCHVSHIIYVVCSQCTRDEWLTTLSGLTLGIVCIAGVGCALVCVGVGEEQARKIYVEVASEVWRDK
jgi:hypothetical protein